MSAAKEFYRSDGVRITHDPYETGMAEKYGTPGKTDSEGFDPYADSVGAGIYGGIVKRDESGDVVRVSYNIYLSMNVVHKMQSLV